METKYYLVIVQFVKEKTRWQFMIILYKTEGLDSFFKTLENISAKAGKKLATKLLKNPSRSLEIGAKVASSTASRNL